MIDRLAWIWVVQVICGGEARPSLSRAQLTERLLSHHGSLLQAFNHRRVSNRKPVNNCLKEDQPPHYQCSDTETTGCTRNRTILYNNKHNPSWWFNN